MTAQLRRADMLCFDGQSLAIAPGTADAFPAKVMASRPGDVGVVIAKGGTSWPDRLAMPDLRADRHLGSVSGRRIFIDCGGTFDLNLGFPAASIIANAEQMWDTRRAAGWDLIVATTIPDSTGFDATEDTTRVTVNASILASPSLDAALDLSAIEVEGVAVLEDATNLTYWNADGVHWLATATSLVAAALLEVLP